MIAHLLAEPLFPGVYAASALSAHEYEARLLIMQWQELECGTGDIIYSPSQNFKIEADGQRLKLTAKRGIAGLQPGGIAGLRASLARDFADVSYGPWTNGIAFLITLHPELEVA